MTKDDFDTNDPATAERVLERWCPELSDRHLILEQLLRSIGIAERLAPDSWSATLLKDQSGFRLNVGPVDAFGYLNGTVHLLLLGVVPAEANQIADVTPGPYSVPWPHNVVDCDIDGFRRLSAVLQSAHAEFLRAAAVTSKGKPRGATYARYHSPGLYDYATRFLAEQSEA